ncbi:CD99 antigen isoform X2 [Sorex araneus]|uniref:CD99 antigen isoform X2 n=1 Tax=Sorex araneus TaxID=42254 RepID=UPI002433FF56|nr:CD99 antigen isoform X2 [Sorex araneus]
MSRRALLALLLAALLACALPAARGQDFDLSDALDGKPTPKPPKKPSGPVDDLDLGDALAGGDTGGFDPQPPNPPKPRPNPNPKQPGTSGGFSDADLLDGHSNAGGFSDTDLLDGHSDGGGGYPGNHRKDGDGEAQADSPGVISGIVGAVVVAVAGAVSSFIAYQKKKWCFKENDQADINMENQHRTNAEPPVQQTLLKR